MKGNLKMNTNFKNDDKEFLVREITSKYAEKENDTLAELQKLDGKVKRPADVFAYSFGILSSLIMGSGMSLVMTDIGNTLGLNNCTPIGIAVGVIGMALVLINYPIYKRILSSRRKKYSEKILALSEKILKKQ